MNMSYCKFENTLADMRDCLDTLETGGSVKRITEEMSEEELASFKRMNKVAQQIVVAYENLRMNEDQEEEMDID